MKQICTEYKRYKKIFLAHIIKEFENNIVWSKITYIIPHPHTHARI